MKSILDLARPEIRAMTPYSSARREQSDGKIWLNANENPWSPSPEDELNRYPDPQPQELLKCLSKLYQVTPEHLLVARGSDEIIDLLLRVFCTAGKDAIVICPPTYGMYKIAAIIQNAAVVEIPLLKDQGFALDSKKILANWQPNIKLIFLCSPNNPTGNVLSRDEILNLCRQLADKALIVVDEAYIEFAAVPSLIQSIPDYSNLVILRTLSKAYGLAGIRCGTMIANPIVVQLLQQVLAPYPIPRPVANMTSQLITEEMLEKVKQRIQVLLQQREWLYQQLNQLSFVEQIWPSAANFILLKVNHAEKILTVCQQRGIVIRDRSRDYGLNNCIRITVGTPEENQLLMEGLKHA